MYSVCVRDHFMIAHSFDGAVFGPAQKLHGATYVVDAEFKNESLDSNGIIVDIGIASSILAAVLGDLNYRNLDEDPSLAGKNTTTETLARVIFDRITARIAAGELGQAAKRPQGLRIVLHESHIAWAAYEGRLAAD
jgi:6-pyruvoyltetrahydropterin/6-carboxytetrahydropterin synthase